MKEVEVKLAIVLNGENSKDVEELLSIFTGIMYAVKNYSGLNPVKTSISATSISSEYKDERTSNGVETVWTAEDLEGFACDLDRVPNREGWQFSVTKGHFSGYPTVDLDKKDLIKLRRAIDNELEND